VTTSCGRAAADKFESYALDKLTNVFTLDAAPALSPEDLAIVEKAATACRDLRVPET